MVCIQVNIRREPPKYQESRSERAKCADLFMAETVQAVAEPCYRLFQKAKAADEAVGDKCATERTAALAKVQELLLRFVIEGL